MTNILINLKNILEINLARMKLFVTICVILAVAAVSFGCGSNVSIYKQTTFDKGQKVAEVIYESGTN